MLKWLRKMFKKDPPKPEVKPEVIYTGTVAPPLEPVLDARLARGELDAAIALVERRCTERLPITKLKPDTPPPVRKANVPTPPIHRKPIPRYYSPPSPAPAPAPSSSFGAGDFLVGMAVGSLLTGHSESQAKTVLEEKQDGPLYGGGSFGGGGASGSWDSCSPSSSDSYSSSSSSDSCSSSSSSD